MDGYTESEIERQKEHVNRAMDKYSKTKEIKYWFLYIREVKLLNRMKRNKKKKGN